MWHESAEILKKSGVWRRGFNKDRISELWQLRLTKFGYPGFDERTLTKPRCPGFDERTWQGLDIRMSGFPDFLLFMSAFVFVPRKKLFCVFLLLLFMLWLLSWSGSPFPFHLFFVNCAVLPLTLISEFVPSVCFLRSCFVSFSLLRVLFSCPWTFYSKQFLVQFFALFANLFPMS